MKKRAKTDEPCCLSCGVAWTDHLGLQGTCARLKRATDYESLGDAAWAALCADERIAFGIIVGESRQQEVERAGEYRREGVAIIAAALRAATEPAK